MNRRQFLISGTVMITTLPGCALFKRDPGPQVIGKENLEQLVGRAWELRAITMDGNSVVMHVDAQMSLRFDADNQIHGFGGVNQFSRGYAFDQSGLLKWTSELAVTRKSGPPEIQEKERYFLNALGQVNRAIAGKTSLTLQNDDSSAVLTFLAPGAL